MKKNQIKTRERFRGADSEWQKVNMKKNQIKIGKDFEVQTVSGRERPAGTPTKGREGVWTQEE